MAYCTLTDLTDRYGEAEVLAYADRDRDGLADAALVDGVLADVDAEIDTYLAGRYALPLSTTPRVLVRIACELARERLMMASGARLDAEAPERRAADGSRAALRDIAKGTLSIGAPAPAQAVGGVQMQSGGRMWGRQPSQERSVVMGLDQGGVIEAKLDQLLATVSGSGTVSGPASASCTGFPTGYIAAYLRSAIPTGWLPLDGQPATINDNPVLYGMFGGRYSDAIDEQATRAAAISLIPAMTANGQPAGYMASASSIYADSHAAYKAFNRLPRDVDGGDGWVTAANVYTGWLRIDMPVAMGVAKYAITSYEGGGLPGPIVFALEGSTDGGATWTVLDSRSREEKWAKDETRVYELDYAALSGVYASLRINIDDPGYPEPYVSIKELTIYGGQPIYFPPSAAGQFRLPNLSSSPADLPGAVWCVKAG